MIYSNTAEVIAQAAVQSQSDDTIAMVTKSLCSAEPGLDGLREPPVMAFAENWPMHGSAVLLSTASFYLLASLSAVRTSEQGSIEFNHPLRQRTVKILG